MLDIIGHRKSTTTTKMINFDVTLKLKNWGEFEEKQVHHSLDRQTDRQVLQEHIIHVLILKTQLQCPAVFLAYNTTSCQKTTNKQKEKALISSWQILKI